MKNHFLLFPKNNTPSGKGGIALWLSLHLAIPLLLLFSVFFIGPVRLNTVLFDMLPRSKSSRDIMKADAILGEKNGCEMIIVSAALDFEKAKEGAELLYKQFKDSAYFEKISFFFDYSVMEEFNKYLFDYRYLIAGKETVDKLKQGGAEEIAEDALASAYGAFNIFSFTNLELDPFLLTERHMMHFLGSSMLNAGNLSMKDDVLAAEKDGTWYVLLRMTLAPGAVSVSNKNIIAQVYAAADAIKATTPGLELYFSGVPFHSYESSSGAQREISLISTVTLILILILFLFVFRSPLPVIASILAAVVSLGLAAAAALLVFREIHIITFVFGTTLIGTCVDYSVHFFVHWKLNKSLKSGFEIRASIAKSIIMCVISTEICFSVFLFAPFPILKQFAVFSMAGIISSFLTAFFIYPHFKISENKKINIVFFNKKFFLRIKNIFKPAPVRISFIFGLPVCALILILFNLQEVKIKNDISSLYTMSPALLESEKKAAQVLNYGSPGWYFIVTGADTEETLVHETRLIARLEEEIGHGNLASFLATSVFIPSIETQKDTYEAMKSLLPLVPAQFEYFGFQPEYEKSFYNDFTSSAARYCLPADAPSNAGISNLWIGQQGENCYSCVLPLHPAADEAFFRSIAGEFDFVHFVNKVQDIGRDLDTITRTMFIFYLIAYLLISVVVFCVYSLRDGIKICAAPVFIILFTAAILAVNKIPLGFFSVAALVLVFGLGMDYVFHMIQKKETGHTRLAVIVSFLTTILSFGALALSSFTPAHIFGLSVSAGLSGAFIIAMLLQGAES